ncbi:other/FunK1 protein kinase [Coprinopsis cinerea AmutBmut pab1-1]|nr:other/FunK1 protein kinase [Coprinopsis cinerea AmutBmut pab1-1]
MTQRPDLLIRLLASLLCSSASDLGHDPLITLLPDFNYVYEIPPDGCTGPLYYKTIAPISGSRPISSLVAACVSGRLSRWNPPRTLSASQERPIE